MNALKLFLASNLFVATFLFAPPPPVVPPVANESQPEYVTTATPAEEPVEVVSVAEEAALDDSRPIVGRVTASMLNVRDEPNGAYVVDTLENGTEITILRERDGWYKIDTGQWVSADWVLVEGTAPPQAEELDAPLSENACGEVCWIDNATYWTPAPQHITGRAVMYAPGVMEATARYNGFDLSGFKGGVAMSSAAQLGQVVWLRNAAIGEWEGPYLVVDVSSRASVWTHIVDRHQSVEVDFNTAVEWGMAKRGGDMGYTILQGGMLDVEVWTGLVPPDETVSSSDATVYRDFFLNHAHFGDEGLGNNILWSTVYAEFTNFGGYQTAMDDLPVDLALGGF